MFAMLGILGCVVTTVTAVAAVVGVIASGVSIYVSYENGKDQEAAAKKAKAQQQTFHIQQLKMQKADRLRQKFLTQENLKKTRAAVMTSVGLNTLMADRANREANQLRRENALNSAGVINDVATKPKGTYFYGKAH